MDATKSSEITQQYPVIVRRTCTTDAKGVTELMSCPEVFRELLQLPYPSIELWQERFTKLPAESYSLVAVIDERVVGIIGLHKVDQNVRRQHARTIGLGVHSEWWGRGVGSALMAAAIDLADNWLNVVRLELTVYVDNQRAKQLYEKFGFVAEGVHCAFAFRDGVWADALAMARLRSDKPLLEPVAQT